MVDMVNIFSIRQFGQVLDLTLLLGVILFLDSFVSFIKKNRSYNQLSIIKASQQFRNLMKGGNSI